MQRRYVAENFSPCPSSVSSWAQSSLFFFFSLDELVGRTGHWITKGRGSEALWAMDRMVGLTASFLSRRGRIRTQKQRCSYRYISYFSTPDNGASLSRLWAVCGLGNQKSVSKRLGLLPSIRQKIFHFCPGGEKPGRLFILDCLDSQLAARRKKKRIVYQKTLFMLYIRWNYWRKWGNVIFFQND